MDSDSNSPSQERQENSSQLSSQSLYYRRPRDPAIPETKRNLLNHLQVGLKSERADDQQSSLQGILNFMKPGGDNLEYLIEFDFIPHLAKYISECQTHVTLKLTAYTIVKQISRISLEGFSQHIIHLVSTEMDDLLRQREHTKIELDILREVIAILSQMARDQWHHFSMVKQTRIQKTILLLQSNWINQNVRQACYVLLFKLCKSTGKIGFIDFQLGALFLLDLILKDHQNIDGIYQELLNLIFRYKHHLRFADKIWHQENALPSFIKKFQNFNIPEQKSKPSIFNKFYNLIFQAMLQEQGQWPEYIKHGLLVEMAKTLEYKNWEATDTDERDNIYLIIMEMLQEIISINSELTNQIIKNQSLCIQLSKLCQYDPINFANNTIDIFIQLMNYGDERLIYECYIKSSIIEQIVRYLNQGYESIQDMVQYLLRLEQMFKLGERVSEGNNQLIIIFNQQKPINFLEEMLRTQFEEQQEIISRIIIGYVDPIESQ